MINVEQLKQIMPYAPHERREIFAPMLNAACVKYAINSPMRVAHFLAQVGHESGSLRYTLELASGEAYEGRRDLGNIHPGDGVRYKGRGLIQLTGRANYEEYGKDLDEDLITHPERVETEFAADVAGWFWHRRNLNKWADLDDVRMITKRINGGYNGLEDRKQFLQRAKQALGC